MTIRDQLPSLEGVAYLNAGTCGPLPASAAQAIGGALVQAVAGGRTHAYFEQMLDTRTRLRESYAQLVGAARRDRTVHAHARRARDCHEPLQRRVDRCHARAERYEVHDRRARVR